MCLDDVNGLLESVPEMRGTSAGWNHLRDDYNIQTKPIW